MTVKLIGAGLAGLVLLASTAIASAQAIVYPPYSWGYGYPYAYGVSPFGYAYAPGYYYGYAPYDYEGVAGDGGW
jgi:hypothetical protein